MRSIYFSITLLSIVQLTAFGNSENPICSESGEIYKLGTFTGIELKNSANVFITQGKENNYKIEYETEKEIPYINIVTKKDMLIISTDKKFTEDKPATIYITVTNLRLIEISGSGTITILNPVKSKNIEMRIKGSGSINAALESKNLKMIISGSGNIEVKGKINASDIKISGSGNIYARDLKTSESSVIITGSGSGTVDVDDELIVDIYGSGILYYVKEPVRMHARSKTTGHIEKIKA